MNFTKIALTCGLALAIGSASAAGAMTTKPGLGVSFTSNNNLALSYYFGHNNTNVVSLAAGYAKQDFDVEINGLGQVFSDDNTTIPVSISFTHLFSLDQTNNLFWGVGASYQQRFGSVKIDNVSYDNQSWATALHVGLQYRVTPRFYLHAGIPIVTYGVTKFKNFDQKTTTTAVGSGYAGATYLF